MTGTDALLAAYEEQLRGHVPERLPAGMRAERDGPLVRTVGSLRGGMVGYRDLGGLAGAGLDALIRRQVQVFAQRGESFEWKTHGHDAPADLPDRLRAAGFVSEPRETVMVAALSAIARAPRPPADVALREVTDEADLARIAALETHVWQQDHGWLAPMLGAWRTFDPGAFRVVAAEARGEVVFAPPGCTSWAGRRSPGCTAAPRCRRGAVAARTARSSPTARDSRPKRAVATYRWMPPARAGRSSSSSGSA